VTVSLKAGEGVAYLSPTILHRGQSYTSATTRRTIHGGFVAGMTCAVHPALLTHLSPTSREKFEGWRARTAQHLDAAEVALRAVVGGDRGGYLVALEALVPGRRPLHGRRHDTILLSKIARRVATIHGADGLCEAIAAAGSFADASPELQELVPPGYVKATGDGFLVWNHRPSATLWQVELALWFSADEAAQLWRVFQPIDAGMRGVAEGWEPGFQCGPTRYDFHEVSQAHAARIDRFLASGVGDAKL
jgi:hypothetical protein